MDIKEYSSYGEVVAKLLDDELQAQSRINILGRKVDSPQDLAVLSQVYRDPRMETFRYIFLKDNIIVGSSAVSARMPDRSVTFIDDKDKFIDFIIHSAKKVDADTFYFQHNHPSGSPRASREDFKVSEHISELITEKSDLKYAGHVIINSFQYGFIPSDALDVYDAFITDLWDIEPDYSLDKFRSKNTFLQQSIRDNRELAQLAKSLQKNENVVQVIGTNAKNEINVIYDVGYDFFTSDLKSKLQAISKNQGANKIFLTNLELSKLKRTQKNDLDMFFDVITKDGKSLRELRQLGGYLEPIENESFTVHEYGEEYKYEIETPKVYPNVEVNEIQGEFDFFKQTVDSHEKQFNFAKKKVNKNETSKNRQTSSGAGRSDSDGMAGNKQPEPLSGAFATRDSFFGPLFSKENGARTIEEVRTSTKESSSDRDQRDSIKGNIRSGSTIGGSSGTDHRAADSSGGVQTDIPNIIYEDFTLTKGQEKKLIDEIERYKRGGFNDGWSRASEAVFTNAGYKKESSKTEQAIKNGLKTKFQIARVYTRSAQYKLEVLRKVLNVKAKDISTEQLLDILHPGRHKNIGDNLFPFQKHWKRKFKKVGEPHLDLILRVASTIEKPHVFSSVCSFINGEIEDRLQNGGYTEKELSEEDMFEHIVNNALEDVSNIPGEDYKKIQGLKVGSLKDPHLALTGRERLSYHSNITEDQISKINSDIFLNDALTKVDQLGLGELIRARGLLIKRIEEQKKANASDEMLKSLNVELGYIRRKISDKEMFNQAVKTATEIKKAGDDGIDMLSLLNNAQSEEEYYQDATEKMLPTLRKRLRYIEAVLPEFKNDLEEWQNKSYASSNLQIEFGQDDFGEPLSKNVKYLNERRKVKAIARIKETIKDLEEEKDLLIDYPTDEKRESFYLSETNLLPTPWGLLEEGQGLTKNRQPFKRKVNTTEEVQNEELEVNLEDPGLNQNQKDIEIGLEFESWRINRIQGAFDPGTITPSTYKTWLSFNYPERENDFQELFNVWNIIDNRSFLKEYDLDNDMKLILSQNSDTFFLYDESSNDFTILGFKPEMDRDSAVFAAIDIHKNHENRLSDLKLRAKSAKGIVERTNNTSAETLGNTIGITKDEAEDVLQELEQQGVVTAKGDKITKGHGDRDVVVNREEKIPTPKISLDDTPKPAENIQMLHNATNGRNFKIRDLEGLVPSGNITKIKANIKAIETLKLIESENRVASEDEKEVLSHYVGWGGLKKLFDRYNQTETLRKYSEELKLVLSDEEWESAARSTLNSHYTSPEIIQGMWEGLQELGFKGGEIGEPAGGIGHFIGLMPESISQNSNIFTVECDDISARILDQLYPDALNQKAYFEDAAFKNNSLDLIISNVPFLENPHRDPRYDKMHLHDYFFNKGVDILKPGGVMMAITTSGSLDSSRSLKSRKILAEKADLIGAIRLPSDAFKANAGADVTTDILIYRKKTGSEEISNKFTHVREFAIPDKLSSDLKEQKLKIQNSIKELQTELKNDDLSEWRIDFKKSQIKDYKSDLEKLKVKINEYYVENPQNLLGELTISGGRYADRPEQSLINSGLDLKEEIKKAITALPSDLFEKTVKLKVRNELLIASSDDKPYSFIIKDQMVYQNIEGFLTEVNGFKSPAMLRRAADFIEVRDAAINAVNSQVTQGLSDEEVEIARLELVEKFEAFKNRHGSPWKPAVQRQFKTDPEFPLLLSLENVEAVIEDGIINQVYKPTGLLLGRTSWPLQIPSEANTLEDAYKISIAYQGTVDVDYISSLLKKDIRDIEQNLISEELVYRDPESGLLIQKEDYLSGNVREKLNSVNKFLGTHPEFEVNQKALEDKIPGDVGIDQIRFQLGSNWLPAEVLNSWVKATFNNNSTFNYNEVLTEWTISGYISNDPEFSTDRIRTEDILQATLNLRSVKVYDQIYLGGGKNQRKLNERETAYALEKQNALKQSFVDFVKDNPEQYKKVEKEFNNRFNSFAAKEYEVPDIEYYPGASKHLKLRDYQKASVSRMVHEATLLAHAVGAGKTVEIMTTCMEKKRLGIAKKSMIVVQNATVAQFATSFKQQYPSAKLLAPLDKKEYSSKYRKLFLSRIASNDWDAIIIPQSFFNLIQDDNEIVKEFYQEQIDELTEAKDETSEKRTVRQLQRAIDKLEGIRDSYLKEKKDETLTFNQLGVDCLVLDEAHEYKKLGISTKLDQIKGLDTNVSKRAQRAYMKIRTVRAKSNDRNIILATGTPITNTLAELYTMLKMTNENTLRAYGVHKFDEFAATFTEAVTQPELTSTNTLKMVTRLSKFINQPQLIQMFKQSADVLTSRMLNESGQVSKPKIIGGKPQGIVIERSEWLEKYMESLKDELSAFEKMTGALKRENSHIPLTVTTRARKAAVDPRLLGDVDGLPSPPDDPNSKANTVVEEILRIADEVNDLSGTQMVFSDVYQSPNKSFNLFVDMKTKLVERGFPEDQIAIIHDYKTEAKKEKLFEDMNSGRVRVLFGTTDTMGVGVNAQERMKALHHMDAPWMPMQVAQRNGRIDRPGNIYADNGGIYIQTYGVEKTMDAAIFQKILTKQQFIESVLEGGVNSAEIENTSTEMQVSAQEFTALFSGNPDVMRKFQLESEIKVLEQQQSSWKRQLTSTRNKLESAEAFLEDNRYKLDKAEQSYQRLSSLSDSLKENKTIEFNGEELSGKEIKPALNNFFNDVLEKKEEVYGEGKSKVVKTELKTYSIKVNNFLVEVKADVPYTITGKPKGPAYLEYSIKSEHPEIRGTVSTGSGIISSLSKQVASKPQKYLDDVKSSIQSWESRIDNMKSFLKKPFRQEEELSSKRKELDSIVIEETVEEETKDFSFTRTNFTQKEVKKVKL